MSIPRASNKVEYRSIRRYCSSYSEKRRSRFINFSFLAFILILVLVCFGTNSENKCDFFTGATINSASPTSFGHRHGSLGYYEGKPTTVSSSSTDGYSKVESLADDGNWIRLSDHPRFRKTSNLNIFLILFSNIHAHNLIGMPSGALMMIGGYKRQTDDYVTDIWLLQSEVWTLVGNLQKVK